MSYEKPEDKWKREKQYQPPAPGQPGRPPVAPGDEARWHQEKQGRIAARPGGPGPNQPPAPQPPNGPEAQWLREKQGQRPVPPPPNGPEQQWLREKQGQQPPQVGPEQQWLREKQGQPPVGTPPPLPGRPNQPPLSQQEIGWHQAKNVPTATVKRSRTGLYLGLGIGAVLLVAAIIILAIVLLSPKSGPSTTATTTVVASTETATTAAVTTARAVTTAPGIVAVTTPPINQSPVPTTVSIGDSARLLVLAEDAAKNSRWEDVIKSLELLSTTDPNFSKGKPLLVKAYFELAEQQVTQGGNNEESANRALIYYRKASAIDPSFEGLGKALQRAEKYAVGVLQYESEQYNQTVNTLRPLYDESQLEKEGVHYRNTADILYNSYIKLGDNLFNLNNVADLTQARGRYSEALALDVNNKDVANSKLQQVDRAIKLLGPTPKK